MATPDLDSRHADAARGFNSGLVAGYCVIVLVALLPLVGVHSYVELTDYSRWAWTDAAWPAVALAAAFWMLYRYSEGAGWLLAIVAVAFATLSAQIYYVLSEIDEPMSQEYLDAIAVLLGHPTLMMLGGFGLATHFFRSR